jgi:hypothetical protein
MRKLILLVALTACGSSSSGGLPFTPNTELASYGPFPDGGVDPRFVVVAIAKIDQGPLDCAALSEGASRTGQALGIVVGRLDGSPFATGAYPIVRDVSTLDAGIGADLTLIDSSGNTLGVGVSGTVNLTSVGSTYAGNYNAEVLLVAGGNTAYEGNFSAPLCGQ